MAQILQVPKRQSAQLLERGVAQGASDFVSAMLERQRLNRIGKERATIDAAIANAESSDEAYALVSAGSPEVREVHEGSFLERIKIQFPGDVSFQAIDSVTGQPVTIGHHPDRPPTTETLRARGLEAPVETAVIVTIDGKTTIAQAASSISAAKKDLELLRQSLPPGATAELAFGDEIATFEGIASRNLQREQLTLQRDTLKENKRQFELSGSDFAIISTGTVSGRAGQLEALQFADTEEEANEDAARLQELFPDKTFTVAPRGQIDDFFTAQELQLRQRTIDAQRAGATGSLSVAQQELNANIFIETRADPLVTPAGVTALQSRQPEINRAWETFNGQFAGDLFSLESEEAAPLVRTGQSITSTLFAREESFQRSLDIAFNHQIMGSVLPDLLLGQDPNSAIVGEMTKRLGLTPDEVKTLGERIRNGEFIGLAEYDPKNPSPTFGTVTIGTKTIQIIMVKGNIVPFSRARVGTQ